MSPNREGMLIHGSILYLIMALVAITAMRFGHQNLMLLNPVMTTSIWKSIGSWLYMASLMAGVLLCLSWFFQQWFVTYRAARELMMNLFGGMNGIQVTYLAMISAFCEELLFRGALQPFMGIFFTSCLFGLLHVGPGRWLSAWSLWALAAGMLLGLSVEQTQSLWPAILAHFLINVSSMLMMKREYRKIVEQRQRAAGLLSNLSQ